MRIFILKNRGGSAGRDLFVNFSDRGALRLSAEVSHTPALGGHITADWTDTEEFRAALYLGPVILSVGLRGTMAHRFAKRIGRPIDRTGSAESRLGVRVCLGRSQFAPVLH